MSISLNEIVSILASRVGKPFSIPLQEELKKIINYKRANYFQQIIEKNPGQRIFFTQQFVTKLEKVNNENDICGFTTSTKCPLLRTECEIPKPLRNSFTLFDFVGYANFTEGFALTNPEFLSTIKYNKYTGKTEKYYYINNRIYVYNNLSIRYVGVRGIFEDPNQVNSCCEDPCYNDDMPFPAPQDIINAIIRDTLQVELRQEFPELGEVAEDVHVQPADAQSDRAK